MPDQKHIVILGPAYPLRGGGMATFNERLAREYIRLGHRVTIYTFSLQYPSFLFPGKSQYSTEPAPTDLDIRVMVNSVNPFNWEVVGRELKKLAPDLIIVRYWLPLIGPSLGRILRIAKKNRKTKVVCIADNVMPHEKRPGDVWFTKYFVKAPDAFVTMSEKVQSDLLMFVKHKPIQLLRHPLYDNFGDPLPKAEARKYLGLPETGKLILFFGFIRAYKGLDLLIRAMADPEVRAQQIKLLVAGEFYQDAQPYLDLIRELHLEDAIILRTEFITDSEVRYYCSAPDCIVQPYRNATQSGVTPLAYHFSKPMIVTNVGGLPAMVPHEKVGLVALPDPASIAAQIIRFYTMGEEHFLPFIEAEKEHYSWQAFAESILQLPYDHQG
jgi:glycosyltransferase involved in cell wall biosynthesis